MFLIIAISSAFLSAMSNGSAVVLEKIAVDRISNKQTSGINLFLNLRSSLNYIIGVVLDIIAWLLSLVAVHRLPLFVVQPIIACSVIVTILIEMIILKSKPTLKLILSLGLMFVGLGLLTAIASPERPTKISTLTEFWLVITPLILTLLGIIFTKYLAKYSTFVLASITGLSFGAIAVVGRALHFGKNYLSVFGSPLIWSIFIYSVVGMIFFTIALKKARASYVNTIVIAFETIFPILFGIIFFHDHPKNNLWLIAVIGFVLTTVGTILILNTIGKKILEQI